MVSHYSRWQMLLLKSLCTEYNLEAQTGRKQTICINIFVYENYFIMSHYTVSLSSQICTCQNNCNKNDQCWLTCERLRKTNKALPQFPHLALICSTLPKDNRSYCGTTCFASIQDNHHLCWQKVLRTSKEVRILPAHLHFIIELWLLLYFLDNEQVAGITACCGRVCVGFNTLLHKTRNMNLVPVSYDKSTF